MCNKRKGVSGTVRIFQSVKIFIQKIPPTKISRGRESIIKQPIIVKIKIEIAFMFRLPFVYMIFNYWPVSPVYFDSTVLKVLNCRFVLYLFCWDVIVAQCTAIFSDLLRSLEFRYY